MVLSSLFKSLLSFLFPESSLSTPTAQMLGVRRAPSRQSGADALTLFRYHDETVKQLLWRLKFRGDRRVAKLFASLLYENLLEELGDKLIYEDFQNPLLIPIPRSRGKLRERGFNQVEMLAKSLVELDNNQSFTLHSDLLEKVKDTESQVAQKDRAARIKNLRGAFRVAKPDITQNRNVILLDDVITTGAPMREARETLREAGAREILCIALAH